MADDNVQIPASADDRPDEMRKLDRDGRDRPAFVLNFPQDPQLDALVAAFEAGNFAKVRHEAPQLAASAKNPAVRSAALELRRRIEPDGTVVLLLVMAVLLLSFVALWAYSTGPASAR